MGYRWHDTKGIPALFPFGHGLSYTEFSYGRPQLSASAIGEGESLEITIPVANCGTTPGKETLQLYVAAPGKEVTRAAKELKDFAKIDLLPGERKEVTLRVNADDLRYYDEASRDWKLEQGDYRILVGASSADIRATADFSVKI